MTLVQQLDELLGGGLRPCQLTEVSGVPGVGKTQVPARWHLHAPRHTFNRAHAHTTICLVVALTSSSHALCR